MPAGVNHEPHPYPNHQRRIQMVPLALWSVAVLIIFVATILLADDRKYLRLLSGSVFGPSSNVDLGPATVAAPPAQESAAGRPPLLALPPADMRPLIRLKSSEARCESLTRPNQELPVYLETGSSSQCTLLYRHDEKQASPSVFIQIQTDETGMVSSFRLKFNTEGKTAEEVISKGIEFMKTHGGFFLKTEDFISVISERIGRWKNFRTLLGPYLVEMNQEILDPTRFNVLGRLRQEHPSSDNLWRNIQGSIFRG